MNEFDVFGPSQIAEQTVVVHLIAPGLGCSWVGSDEFSQTDERESTRQVIRHHLSSAPQRQFPEYHLRYTSQRSDEGGHWLLDIGHILAMERVHNITSTSPLPQKQGRKYKREVRYDFSRRASLHITRTGNSMKLGGRQIAGIEAPMREWLARGLFFMGVPFEQAIAVCQAKATHHEILEWETKRQEAVSEMKRWHEQET